MQEFDCIKVSSYEAETLSAKLTERSADGWDVVSIVPAGSDIVAYLRRESDGAAASMSSTASTAASTAEEPSGWGSAPAESTGPEPTATTAEPAASGDSGWGTAGSGSSWGSSSGSSSSGDSWGSSSSSEPAAASSGASSSPSVPAGWYSDPANRYELRYWDGSAWTEHVSRGGQQYTDPPVA